MSALAAGHPFLYGLILITFTVIPTIVFLAWVLPWFRDCRFRKHRFVKVGTASIVSQSSVQVRDLLGRPVGPAEPPAPQQGPWEDYWQCIDCGHGCSIEPDLPRGMAYCPKSNVRPTLKESRLGDYDCRASAVVTPDPENAGAFRWEEKEVPT